MRSSRVVDPLAGRACTGIPLSRWWWQGQMGGGCLSRVAFAFCALTLALGAATASAQLAPLFSFGTPGSGAGQFQTPIGVAVQHRTATSTSPTAPTRGSRSSTPPPSSRAPGAGGSRTARAGRGLQEELPAGHSRFGTGPVRQSHEHRGRHQADQGVHRRRRQQRGVPVHLERPLQGDNRWHHHSAGPLPGRRGRGRGSDRQPVGGRREHQQHLRVRYQGQVRAKWKGPRSVKRSGSRSTRPTTPST